MLQKTATWINKSGTGAGSTVIDAAVTSGEKQYWNRYITGVNADVIGLGAGEYIKIGVNPSATTAMFYSETNGYHPVDYRGTSGMLGSRLAGPASTALYVVRTGAATRFTVDVGQFLAK